jgi:hypothetical protein
VVVGPQHVTAPANDAALLRDSDAVDLVRTEPHRRRRRLGRLVDGARLPLRLAGEHRLDVRAVRRDARRRL